METQTEPKKPAPPKAPPKAEATLPELPKLDWQKPVPVAIVRLEKGVIIPGKTVDVNGYMKSTPLAEREARPDVDIWDVEYIAAIRHFRITYVSKGRKRNELAFNHESRALSWEPVA